MSKEITPEELSQVRELNARYAKVFSEIGQASVKIEEYKRVLSDLEEEKATLYQDYLTILQKEEEVIKGLNAKYGEGKLDLNTGIISVE